MSSILRKCDLRTGWRAKLFAEKEALARNNTNDANGHEETRSLEDSMRIQRYIFLYKGYMVRKVGY